MPLSEVAQFFWRHYKKNLLALSALQGIRRHESFGNTGAREHWYQGLRLLRKSGA